MKRSEIIQLIADFLHYNPHYLYYEKTSCEDDANVLLKQIEKVGMLPPKRWRDKDWNEKGITYSDWIQLPSKINEWESENE